MEFPRADWQKSALVLAGHGSSRNPWSALPVYQNAQRIRQLGLFAEVHECFWKEEPNFHQVLRQVESSTIFVVPYFLAKGYFTQEVLPRELGLTGRFTIRAGRKIFYCDPVGTHPSLERVLHDRIHQLWEGHPAPVDPKRIALILVGHGTSLSEESSEVVRHWIDRFQQKKSYGECHAAFLDEAPYIAQWWEWTQREAVVIVPYFVSQGLHTYRDIPRLVGIENKKPFGGPHSIRGHKVWYTEPIGTDPGIVDVILQQVASWRECNRPVSKVAPN
ncbi:CbiX/SirB N-terminal domain-containing protein [Candidatus Methylacidithermus pantelleriae]|uniref:CbiX/SirB N-terminal domain-containing protein n=1 Tax=Candidatus Methylacidithermus pantelleriae TaxID=2744239 RepID=UPI00157DC3E9|nr:CbiX/SirB N-terminal domain-containing protein [Candidatus Methylacidithermus pantelleriae]